MISQSTLVKSPSANMILCLNPILDCPSLSYIASVRYSRESLEDNDDIYAENDNCDFFGSQMLPLA